MTYVIFSRTYEQYIQCCHQRCLRIDSVPWIQKPSDIEKIRGPVNPIFFGDYWTNPQYIEIIRAMASKGIGHGGKLIRKELDRIDFDSKFTSKAKGIGAFPKDRDI